jgi:DNA-directed RNA polymerase specialized sigma24 family protein
MGKCGATSPGDQVREVVYHLGVHFGHALSATDREDLAQLAYCELLERERLGETIEAPVTLMKRIAWRDARDLLRDRREAATDPTASIFLTLSDPGPSPESRLLARADLARALEAIERLDEPLGAAYRARLGGLAPRQASLALGIPRSTYCYRLRRANETLEATLDSARFRAIELALLGAYVAGIASSKERRRAERLISADPHAVAVARRLRRLCHRRVSATSSKRRGRAGAYWPADPTHPGSGTRGATGCK